MWPGITRPIYRPLLLLRGCCRAEYRSGSTESNARETGEPITAQYRRIPCVPPLLWNNFHYLFTPLYISKYRYHGLFGEPVTRSNWFLTQGDFCNSAFMDGKHCSQVEWINSEDKCTVRTAQRTQKRIEGTYYHWSLWEGYLHSRRHPPLLSWSPLRGCPSTDVE